MYKKLIFVLLIAMMFCGVVSANQISDLGNDVYFFNGYPEKFGSDLSQFLTDHSYLRVVSIAAFDHGLYGATSGYYVIVENKSVGKMIWNPIRNGSISVIYTCTTE